MRSDFADDQSDPTRRGHSKPQRKRLKTRIKRPPLNETWFKGDWSLTFSRDREDPWFHRWVIRLGELVIGDFWRRPTELWDKIPNPAEAPSTPLKSRLATLKTEHEAIQELRMINFWDKAHHFRK